MQLFVGRIRFALLCAIFNVSTNGLVTRHSTVKSEAYVPESAAVVFSSGNDDPDVQGGHPDIHSEKAQIWRKEKGGGYKAYAMAICFVFLVGSMPLWIHAPDVYYGGHPLTNTEIFETCCLFVWLTGGLYLFTNVLIFQSIHFEEPRNLSLEEAVYLFSQILTTVGYGDITPAKKRGQFFVGIFVFLSIMLIANMVSELTDVMQEHMKRKMKALGYHDSDDEEDAHADIEKKAKIAFKPVKMSFCAFLFFVFVGTCFFHLCPGEGKTWAQGVYMSTITLSTVGFGAFTPVTHTGMVFGAFWMLFGVGAFGAFITAYTAWSSTMKQYEEYETERLAHADDPNWTPHTTARSSRSGKLGKKKKAAKWEDSEQGTPRTSP